MLIHLYIKNIALIDEIHLDLHESFNILTGETGAGKSILIDSINLALGGRVNRELIRNKEEEAVVELLFQIHNETTLKILEKFGLSTDEEQCLLVSRTIQKTGRSLSRINGRLVTLSMLKEITAHLIDVHGQHEHQSLLNTSMHIELLDQFCPKELKELKQQLSILYQKYSQFKHQLNRFSFNEQEKIRQLDLLEFQLNEINQANLREEEEEKLLVKRKIYSNAQKISTGLYQVYQLLQGENQQTKSVIEQLGEVISILGELSTIDPSLNSLYQNIETIHIQLQEYNRDLSTYLVEIENDPHILDQIENRLHIIYNLKRKYGSSITEILRYKKQLESEIEILQHSQEHNEYIRKEMNKIQKQMEELCHSITIIRKKTGLQLEQQIEKHLQSLQLKDSKFKISIENKINISSNGWDKVEFLISTNIGEPVKPLTKIASGGEMSRIMLAIKTVLADVDDIETLIFDEIDTGISGRTAQKVAEKLMFIAKQHQIICITHLPQIAAMADRHYLIQKTTKNTHTTTYIHLLSDEQIIQELARLVGGAVITSTTLKNAKEMKQLANQLKVNKN
ncbi:MAG: DNA repair protein RecN [Epulopiscium sp.]|nr:DNA repair protein RecN [Candidatus Epulonipiscium sp.]